MELTDEEVAVIQRMRKDPTERRAEALLAHKQRAQETIDRIDAELAGRKFDSVRAKLGIRLPAKANN
jgi:hypothetical protein